MWGSNTSGQLGNSDTGTNLTVPTPLMESQTFTKVAAGGSHSLALGSDGRVWAWGSNQLWQLGTGSTNLFESTPAVAAPGWLFKEIAAGPNASTGILTVVGVGFNSNVLSWGSGHHGEMGDGVYVGGPYSAGAPRYGPARALPKMATGVRATMIAMGYANIHTQNQSWGNNDVWQTGKKQDWVGYSEFSPVLRTGAPTFASISANSVTALGITESGDLWSWGGGTYGELGLGYASGKSLATKISGDTKFVTSASGWEYSLAVDTEGHIWSWGKSAHGNLGLGDRSSTDGPTDWSTEGNVLAPTLAW